METPRRLETDKEVDDSAPKIRGQDPNSFANKTVKDRWPEIVTKLVDKMKRRREDLLEEYGGTGKQNVDLVLRIYSELRYQLMTDKPLEMLVDNSADVIKWNEFIDDKRTCSDLHDSAVEFLTWYHGEWLFVECYLYRLLYSAFRQTTNLREYDYFADKKQKNFNSHFDHIEEVSQYIMKLADPDAPAHELFGINTIFKMSLWGNRADMSLSGGEEVTMKISPISAASQFAQFVLVDDVSNLIIKVLGPLYEVRDTQSDRRIDIILDNAGVELVGDLVLAEFLIARGFADEVVLHGKSMPWFVSDVTQKDFDWTLEALTRVGEQSKKFSDRIRQRLESGQMKYESHEFWTFPHAYYQMEEVAPDLYAELSTSRLAIFKGDLNYRKLVGDRDWDYTEKFDRALRGFAPCPVFALRTLKAECLCGLTEMQVNELYKEFPDNQDQWLTSGKYGVCQLGAI